MFIRPGIAPAYIESMAVGRPVDELQNASLKALALFSWTIVQEIDGGIHAQTGIPQVTGQEVYICCLSDGTVTVSSRSTRVGFWDWNVNKANVKQFMNELRKHVA